MLSLVAALALSLTGCADGTNQPRTTAQLLAELKLVDKYWKPAPASWDTSAKAIFESGNCIVSVHSSLQDAVNNDSGSHWDSWTYLGTYGQLGITLIPNSDSLNSCEKKLPSSIELLDVATETTKSDQIFRASSQNIAQCLDKHAACLKGSNLSLPSPMLSTYGSSIPNQLALLENQGFCIPSDVGGDWTGLRSCELSGEKWGTSSGLIDQPSGVYATQTKVDRDVLRWATSTSRNYGKYMIYGEGWAVIIYESTVKQKALFVEMNKLMRGTLVSLY